MQNLDARLSLVFKEIKEITSYLEKENQKNKVNSIRSAIQYFRKDIECLVSINEDNKKYFEENVLNFNQVESEGYKRACLEILEFFDRYNEEFFE
jgi:hypothetical protein